MISASPGGGSVRGAIDKYYKRYWHYPSSFQQQTADIFHIVDHSDGHLIPWLKQSGKTVVITCHDLINLVQPQMYRGLSLAPAISMNTWRWSVHRMQNADHVITVSSNTARDVVQHLKVAPTSITTVPNAVSSDFRPLPRAEIAAFRQQHNLPPEMFCLLNVGSNNPRKNVSAVLQVMKILKERQKPVHFWKAGSNFDAEQYEFIDTHQLRDCISYLGKPDDSMLVKLYNSADVLLAPSLYEGFGLTVLEAMACGTPVITSNVSSLPEVAGDAAVTVGPTDYPSMATAVEHLRQDAEFRQHLIDAGLERVKAFTWLNTAEQVAQVYQHVEQSISKAS
ncbi:glycosyltransferase family 4 protein [Oscillatoria sp. CS-180]|uniref:glycosyltransferase family 4 protein n=1 Tax=Oscillatoria sp. CS-180 TaxID=3021720 RepID=UPI00232E93E4|nr:glycosyltransferase family 1 protein [Oscillatoria sp. CS-180]